MNNKQFHVLPVFFYRLAVIYLLYFLCRVMFFVANHHMFDEKSVKELLTIFTGGLLFDTSAILYSNSLFILLSLLPFAFVTRAKYQKVLQWIYIITNSICIAANCADIIYYRFTLKRTTSLIFEQFANETNLLWICLESMVQYWYITLLLIALIVCMIFLYRLVSVREMNTPTKAWVFYPLSTLAFCGIIILTWGGMRGGFRTSTRPISLSNAGKFVASSNEMVLVLNTPFAILRTIGKRSIEAKTYFDSKRETDEYFSAEHQLIADGSMKKENVVVLILESFSSEYTGYFTRDIENYSGYTPFLDSLCEQSLVFESSFANGRKSIDALPSIYLSIPHFKVPYVLSQYSGNKINGMAHILGEKGYSTSFFHGAPNGSMGFNAFTNVLGVESYYGKREYGNNDHFDGVWGIWDELFFQYFAKELSHFEEPFFSTLFSLSSHHPFLIPEEHVGEFPQGNLPLHECIGYTDYALKRFFETAKEQPWFDNTLFVITADHASYEDIPEYRNIVGMYAIPIIFYKGDGSMKRVDTTHVAQQIDILPSVLSYLNYDGAFIAHGKNLFDEESSEYAFYYDNHTYQVVGCQYLLQFDEKGVVGLYEYKKDRFLKNNMKDASPQIVAELYNYGKAFLQECSRRVIEDDMVWEK